MQGISACRSSITKALSRTEKHARNAGSGRSLYWHLAKMTLHLSPAFPSSCLYAPTNRMVTFNLMAEIAVSFILVLVDHTSVCYCR